MFNSICLFLSVYIYIYLSIKDDKNTLVNQSIHLFIYLSENVLIIISIYLFLSIFSFTFLSDSIYITKKTFSLIINLFIYSSICLKICLSTPCSPPSSRISVAHKKSFILSPSSLDKQPSSGSLAGLNKNMVDKYN